MTPLERAAGTGDPFALRALLEAGTDPNERGADGGTALMAAAWTNRVVCARVLGKFGANPNFKTATNFTALTEARSIEMIKTLLDMGADPNICWILRFSTKTPNGTNSSLAADFAYHGEFEKARLLLQFGADGDELGPDGRTVLEMLDAPSEVAARRLKDRSLTKPGNEAEMLSLSENLSLSPGEFYAKATKINPTKFWGYIYEDQRLNDWTNQVFQLLLDPHQAARCCERYLDQEQLAKRAPSLEFRKREYDKELEAERRAAEYLSTYAHEQ